MAETTKPTHVEPFASRSVADLTGDELQTLAGQAFAEAARVARAIAHNVPGVSGGVLDYGLEEDVYIFDMAARAASASTSEEALRQSDRPGLQEAPIEFQRDEPKTS